MEFSFSEELLEIKRIARDFAEKEIRPHVMEWDEKQIFPYDVLKQLADLGFLGVLIPTEYGGAGLGYTEYVTVVEELSRVDGSIGISVAAHNSLCTGHIFNFGNEDQRLRFLPPERAAGFRSKAVAESARAMRPAPAEWRSHPCGATYAPRSARRGLRKQ